MIYNREAVICYYSERGHNNFYYASSTKGVIKQNCFYETLSWVSPDNRFIAIKIKNKYVLPLTVNEKDVKDTITNNIIVVWIER